MTSKKRYFERQTRIEVVIIYLFVIALCAAMFYYIYQLRNSIFMQYDEIDTQDDLIHYTGEFTKAVHEAQSLATQFSLTDEPKYLRSYKKKKDVISLYADSIEMTTSDTAIIKSIHEIQQLIVRKGQISYIMSRQFYHYNPWSEINKLLEEHPIDSSYALIDNNIKTHNPDKILSDIKALTQKAMTEYQQNINSYQSKINELVASDNMISRKISNILIKLNKEIIVSTSSGLKESKNKIEHNIYISVIVAGSVLLMIVIFIVLIFINVGKGLKARKAAEDAQQKTEEIMESRHKLLLSVSHDIKTPLTSILGNLDMLESNGDDNDKVEAMKQSANHILNLLNNLLDFSRIEQGKLTLNNSDFNISALCNETANMFKPLAALKNLDFNFTNNIPQDTYINADNLKLKQLLTNIISNAIKYTIKGQVDFICDIQDNTLIININDTGVGIPKDKIDDIFKPFVRIENHNTFAEGSGYGMSVAKGLCDLMGGQINVESDTNQGSKFQISIPITITYNNTYNEEKSNSDKVTSALIIDDDMTLLTMMEKMILKLGGNSTICGSVAKLEQSLDHLGDYDYILTDREMGALTGNEILSKVKSRQHNKPVILMTARVEYDNQKAVAEGFDGLLLKPFSITQLAEILHLSFNAEKENNGKFADDFSNLYETMGNDDEAVRQILTTFAHSICDDMLLLNEAIEYNNFEQAKNLCHKNLPILTSLQQEQTLDYLRTMNRLNTARNNEDEYPEWKKDTFLFMQQIDELLDMLSSKYGID